eukprot:COSAG01_NODE_5157_length_4446_cov_1.899471_1_plen_301_part_00
MRGKSETACRILRDAALPPLGPAHRAPLHQHPYRERTTLYTPMYVARRLATRKRHVVDRMIGFHPAELPLLTAQLGVGLAELDMAALAARTDSFAAADLRRLASRVAHHAAARAVGGRGAQLQLQQQQQQQRAARPGGQAEAEATQEEEQAGCEPSGRSGGLAERRCCLEVEATEADVELAMQALSPASLAGVKLTSIGSEVKSWAEVGGMAQVKKTLKEMFELPARYPELFASSPIRLRSGVMLYGPSGCGKTMIASTVAKECGMHFISVKGPELLNKYIGASEQNVRQKFEEAKVRPA